MLAGNLVTLFIDMDMLKGNRVTTLREFVISGGALPQTLRRGDWVRVEDEHGDAYYATIENIRDDLIDLFVHFDLSEPTIDGDLDFGQPEVSFSDSQRGQLTAA